MAQKLLVRATLGAVVVVLLVSLRFLPNNGLDRCFIDRATQSPPPTWIDIRDGPLHNGAVVLMWIILVVLSLSVPRKNSAIYDVAFAALWFHSTYWILYSGKAYLGDTMCSSPHNTSYPNGISGHYCYFCFCMLSLPLFFDLRLRENPEISRLQTLKTKMVYSILSVFIAVYMVAAMVTLYRTYMHGYHSARQIFLGTALGTTSHLCMDILLAQRKPDRTHAVLEVSILAVLSIAGLIGYSLTWPAEPVGHAIGSKQVAGHLFCWIIVLSSHRFSNASSVPEVITEKKTQ